MRGWIRGNWRHLMVGLLCAAIVISGTALYLTYRQSEVCSLCGSGKRERYQAPVILNLTTGQSNEIGFTILICLCWSMDCAHSDHWNL